MFSLKALKTVADQIPAQLKYFGNIGIQMKSTSPKRTPAFDEMYTEVVDRLIRQSKIRTTKHKESTKGSTKSHPKPEPEPKPKQNSKDIKVTITKDGFTKKITGQLS